MARRKLFKFSLIILVAVFINSLTSQAASAGDKISAIVTILPQAEFVEKVGGEYVDVTVMIPPGGNPHTYEPTPAQLKKVSNADLYLKVGSGIGFELLWMDKLVSSNKALTIVDTSKGVELLDATEHHKEKTERHHHQRGTKDPHIWLSPKNAIIMVDNIKDALVIQDPEHADTYKRNTKNYIAELRQFDKEFKNRISNKKNRVFMVSHPSWGYFTSLYGLQQISIEIDGKEPTASGLKELIDTAKEKNISFIFASPQFNQKSAEVVAREIKGRVIFINPLAKSYIDELKYVAEILEEELE